MRFLIADDHKIVRTGMRTWLEEEFGKEQTQIDEAGCAADTLALLRNHTYDLLVIDVQMPDTSDFSLLQHVLAINSEQAVIVMSVMNEEIYGPRFLQAGARAYLAKDSDHSIIMQAVRRVISGKRFITDKIADALLEQKQSAITNSPFEKLTDREIEVVTLLLTGATNQEISEKLFIQPSTIASHKMKIFEKLNVQSIVELVKLADLYKFQVS